MFITTSLTFPSMAFLEDLTILFPFVICLMFMLYTSQRQNSIIPTNWPVLGAIPALAVNAHRIHEYATDVLACTGGTFLFKGPSLAKMDMLCTSSPADIHYILSKNFPNYPKGPKFGQIFDILGDGFSNSDGPLWTFHRKTLLLLLNHPSFDSLLKRTIWNKVEKGLLPVLDNISRQGEETDLQEIFQRFGFDLTCAIIIDHDPESLSVDYPHIPCVKAFSHAEEGIFGRHIMPEKIWKLQRLLQTGNEKKLSSAWKIIDEFIYKVLAEKRKEYSNMIHFEAEAEDKNFNFLRALMRELKGQSGTSGDPNKFLRDISFNLMLAGRDSTGSTLSWLFYLIAKNPIVEDNIRKETETQLADKEMGDIRALDLSQLVYLHGAICETLRLFPAVPFQHKIPVQPDTLPSGFQVDRNTTIILFFYTTGRMESVWGKDCMEFKPERWLGKGGIKHQPSYKFPAFNAGPRACLGKHMSFTQIKIVAATIVYHYHVELVEGHQVLPSDSIILQMKYGMKVKLTKIKK